MAITSTVSDIGLFIGRNLGYNLFCYFCLTHSVSAAECLAEKVNFL